MKRLVIGILAHVDSGKTTLSEALLYNCGSIGKLGRVDHRDAFLDTDTIEKDRGITIFSKQAVLETENMVTTLIDTPGHVDFSLEAERTLSVLDYAVLVISGASGVQSHTITLWKLLQHYNIPTFIFVNKMDLPQANKEEILKRLSEKISEACVDFGVMDSSFYENVATFTPELFDEYLNGEKVSEKALISAINERKLFPCCFGSALKNEGVSQFYNILEKYTCEKNISQSFGAKIYKIATDTKGQKLTFMKITGGSLKVKTLLDGKCGQEKINELRIYSGIKYKSVNEVFAGSICAIPNLENTYAGQGIGTETDSGELLLEPIFAYSVILPDNTDITTALKIFKNLENEETKMNVTWNERHKKINVQIMGEVQLEVIKRILSERYNLDVKFAKGSIIYKETIRNTVEGVGHYEPLRHYSEVHLKLEPGKRGSGLRFYTKCSEDILDKNWQRLILSHLAEKTHIGVLAGFPITDMKITLINGRAHIKHTEGGDFRQATYRAVRHGLMQAESVILEPYYNFTLEIPTENVGRAMNDLQLMGGEFSAPDTKGEVSVITGSVAISKIMDYQRDITEYTHGQGKLSLMFDGYKPCANPEEVIAEIGYDCESDIYNTADSVFCAHGSGFTVKWNEVEKYMHIPFESAKKEIITPTIRPHKITPASDEELMKIYENTYGKVERKLPHVMHTPKEEKYNYKGKPKKHECIIVDGYNIVFAWEYLKKAAEDGLDGARELLIDRLSNYKAIKKNRIILVFDGYKVKGNPGESITVKDIEVVFTKEGETADVYIENKAKELSSANRVKVATSDRLEQITVFGYGAVRISALEFLEEIKEAEEKVREFMEKSNNKNNPKMFDGIDWC